jgi:hypothetical protein
MIDDHQSKLQENRYHVIAKNTAGNIVNKQLDIPGSMKDSSTTHQKLEHQMHQNNLQ